MSIWSQAADLTRLRMGVRLAIVGVVATVLASQVVGIQTAAAHSVVNCPQACSVSFQACSGYCDTGYRFDRAQCQFQDAWCSFQCVLNGASFGKALRSCEVACDRDEQFCLQEVAQVNGSCTKLCSLQYTICNLVCQYLEHQL